MKLSKIHLFFFVLLCTMLQVSVMSVQFQPSMSAHHHGGGVGCHGRGPPPHDGNTGGPDGGNNNGQTNGGNTDGQTGETEQI